MWLAEGVQYPGFSGLYLRRKGTNLKKGADNIIARSYAYFVPLGGKYNEGDKTWTFPNGSAIEFGSMNYESNKRDFQSAQYHRIAFDEVTEFTETQYTFMFTRLRKQVGFPIAVGVRGGTNPGGIGHAWVKRRFVTKEAIAAMAGMDWRTETPQGFVFEAPDGRIFLPARLADNPHIDQEDYARRLTLRVGPILRARLLNGDWTITEDSIFDVGWLRYYMQEGFLLNPMNSSLEELLETGINDRSMRRFVTVDTAGTSRDKAREQKGKPPSWSCAAVWDTIAHNNKQWLFLRDMKRDRVGYRDLERMVVSAIEEWEVPECWIENAHFGPALYDRMKDLCPGLKLNMASTQWGIIKGTGRPGKVERSTTLQTMMEDGRLFLPYAENSWLPDFEDEILGWTGNEDETSDQIDVGSYAALVATKEIAHTIMQGSGWMPKRSNRISPVYKGGKSGW